MSDNLRHESAQRYELLKRLITAQEEERQRVARDLHDDLGQDLAGLATGLEVADRFWTERPAQARAQLRQARAMIAETTERAYALILSLRPSALDDLGLAPAVRAQADRVLKDTDIRLDLETRGMGRRLPAEIETALFRVFQEALSNVVRHSNASHVRLSLAAVNGYFEGEILDDGRGFDLREAQSINGGTRGLGLLGMRERITQCGGILEIASRPGDGTRIRLRVPLPEVAHA